MIEKIDIKIFGKEKKDKKPLKLGDIMNTILFTAILLTFIVCTFYVSENATDSQTAMYLGIISLIWIYEEINKKREVKNK